MPPTSSKRRRDSIGLISALANLVRLSPKQRGLYNTLDDAQRQQFREFNSQRRQAYTDIDESQRQLVDRINALPDDNIRGIDSLLLRCPERTRNAETCFIRSSLGIASPPCQQYCLQNLTSWLHTMLRNLPTKVVLIGTDRNDRLTKLELNDFSDSRMYIYIKYHYRSRKEGHELKFTYEPAEIQWTAENSKISSVNPGGMTYVGHPTDDTGTNYSISQSDVMDYFRQQNLDKDVIFDGLGYYLFIGSNQQIDDWYRSLQPDYEDKEEVGIEAIVYNGELKSWWVNSEDEIGPEGVHIYGTMDEQRSQATLTWDRFDGHSIWY